MINLNLAQKSTYFEFRGLELRGREENARKSGFCFKLKAIKREVVR